MGNRTVSPSSMGVRPRTQKMYDGRNVATRPIPVVVDSSDIRAINAAAADQRPKTSAVQFPKGSGNRAAGVNDAVFGTPIAAPGNVISNRAGVFNPLTGTDNFE